MSKLIAGLLPLYAGLYDKQNPDAKNTFNPFINQIVEKFSQNNVEILRSPVCVYESDIEEAIQKFEEEDATAVVILFLAYHPSMVSARTLTQTTLPVIFLDTTECYSFNSLTDPKMISRCHGIHGVQDLCCVLRRMGKEYHLEAGHFEKSDVILRISNLIKASYIAGSFKKSKVGIIGEPFENMGDFALSFDLLEELTGIKTIKLNLELARSLCSSVRQEDLLRQVKHELEIFDQGDGIDEKFIEDSSLCMLAISKWIEQDKLNAFTFNFLDFNKDLGLPSIPFSSACQLMSKGIGYGGEGDVLTAALVAALMKVYPQSTFTEMFCPDWEGNTIFLSHMGEANYSVLQNPTLINKNVPYVSNLNCGIMTGVAGLYREGKGVLVNLSPVEGNKFILILAPCEILEPTAGDNFVNSVRGWMRPELPVEEFLKQYSRLGGTHHSCICYDADIDILKTFGKMMGWEVHDIRK